jgi:hypothetical protein
MGAVLTRLLEVFWTKKLDIVVIGLENRYAVYPSSFSFGIRKAVKQGRILTPLALYIMQWKNYSLVCLGTWGTRGNRPNHWVECESVQKG